MIEPYRYRGLPDLARDINYIVRGGADAFDRVYNTFFDVHDDFNQRIMGSNEPRIVSVARNALPASVADPRRVYDFFSEHGRASPLRSPQEPARLEGKRSGFGGTARRQLDYSLPSRALVPAPTYGRIVRRFRRRGLDYRRKYAVQQTSTWWLWQVFPVATSPAWLILALSLLDCLLITDLSACDAC